MRPRLPHLTALLTAVSLCGMAQCAPPTEVRLEIVSEFGCSGASRAALVVGASEDEVSARAPSSASAECTPLPDGTSALGTVVVSPSSLDREELVLAVSQRDDGLPPDECARRDRSEAAATHCVVARRQLRFARQTSLSVRIDLRRACAGVACASGETCVRGVCIPGVLDARSCQPRCDEGQLGGPRPIAGFGGVVTMAQSSTMPERIAVSPGRVYWSSRRGAEPVLLGATRKGWRAEAVTDIALPEKCNGTRGQTVALLARGGEVLVGDTLGELIWFDLTSGRRIGQFCSAASTSATAAAVGPTDLWVRGVLHVGASNHAGVLHFRWVGDQLSAVSEWSAPTLFGLPPGPLTSAGRTAYFTLDGVLYALPGDSSERITVATVPAGVVDLATDGTHVYGISEAQGGSVWRVRVGGGPIESLSVDVASPMRIVVDGARVYWSEVGRSPTAPGAIKAMVAGQPPVTLWTGRPGALALDVDSEGVYWVDEGTQSILMAPKAAR